MRFAPDPFDYRRRCNLLRDRGLGDVTGLVWEAGEPMIVESLERLTDDELRRVAEHYHEAHR